MAFEFFFGLFGLISSDSKSYHKSRLDGDWRLFNNLGANLFKEAAGSNGQKSPLNLAGSPSNFKKPSDPRQPIFNITGTLANASYSGSVSDGVFSTTSSSSASSVASSGSNSTVTSTATLIKLIDPLNGKKYEFGEAKNASAPSLTGAQQKEEDSAAAVINPADDGITDLNQAKMSKSKRLRALYCKFVCLLLWLQVARLTFGIFYEKSYLTLDLFYLGAERVRILIPILCLAIQAAALSVIFIRNNDETNWLVPFYSSKDYLIRSRSNFRPKIEDYTRRVNISVSLSLIIALVSSISISAYLIHGVMQSDGMISLFDLGVTEKLLANSATSQLTVKASGYNVKMERLALIILAVFDVLWAIYSTYICILVSFYFNLISSIMKIRFHGISKIIEDLAESNTTKTTNQARKITTLYLEHNEACELLDESNDFWQYLIFFTYFTYIPANCYCLYNIFFGDFEVWARFITWVIHAHTGFVILLISFSAAGVSTEIATFLHRVRGLTIGYSCYDLFAITNASMSNTAAACASYFLIVADFSRSSVFNMSQMNSTTAATAASGVATTVASTIASVTTPAST